MYTHTHTHTHTQQWNEELARVAQAHAASCSLSENTNRADNVSFATVGENLSASNAGAPNYTRFVEMGWFSQRDNYDFQSNMCTTQDSCTDYIQVLYIIAHIQSSSYTWMETIVPLAVSVAMPT